jgi:CheY-like chemotaxis protein
MQDARVLVVDDEPLSRDVLVRLLESRGLAVDTAHDGAACLEALSHRIPDLILLDVSMPGMSGLDVLACIRRDHTPDQLPVILVTAMVDSEDVVAGLEAGANDYVVKPVNLPVLLARVGVALRIRKGVERLVEAERHRVMLESLETACEQLASPMTRIIGHLENLIERLPEDDAEVRPKLVDILDWACDTGHLIQTFRNVAGYRREPYTTELGAFETPAEPATRRTGGAS